MSVTRRTVITVTAIVVGVALVVAFVVVAISSRTGGGATAASPTSEATYTSAPTVRPTASSGAGTTPVKPTEKAAPGTQDVPGSTPQATADPGTASGRAQRPVGLTAKAALTSKVSVTLSQLKAVQGKGDGVGEVSGPSLRFVVTIDNSSTKLLNLSSTVVTVTYGADATPSNELVSQRKALPETVAAGATAQGTFTFPVPVKSRSDVRITIDYGVSVPSVVFAGTAPA